MLLIVLLAVTLAIVYALLPAPVPVDIAHAEVGPLQVTVDEDGQTRVRNRYAISSPVQGRLQRIQLEVGEAVTGGESVLAIIQPSHSTLLDPRSRAEAQARVSAARAELQVAQSQQNRTKRSLDQARTELERFTTLAEQNFVTRQELDRARLEVDTLEEELRARQSTVEVARYNLELAQAALRQLDQDEPSESLLIRAPVDGLIFQKFEESERVVSPGTPLVEIGDPTSLEVVVDVLSSDAVRINPGDSVLLQGWGGGKSLPGRVRLVDPSGFTKVSALGVEEQRVNVRVDILVPPGERPALGDGYRVEASIVVWEEPEVLKIPVGALFRSEEQWATYLVVDGKAILREVEIGQQNGMEAQVLSGLKEGDAVALHPGDEVSDNVSVEIRSP